MKIRRPSGALLLLSLLLPMLLIVLPPAPVFAAQVTQPINIPTPTGGSAFTYTVSGCNPSPTSGTSGSTVNFQVDPSCVLTVTMPAAGTNTRYVFGGGASSTTVTTCATGTCTTFQPSDYYQLFDTFKNSEVGTASGLSTPWHYMSGGTSTATAITTTGSSVWVDYNSVVYPEAYNYHSNINTATQQYSASPLTYGLVGYWSFDEATSGTCTGSVYDLSHYNNTGTCINSPTFTTGKFGGALSFNGVNQYVRVPVSNSLKINSVTLTAWLMYTGYPNQYYTILGMGAQASGGFPSGAYEMYSQPSSTQINFQIYNTANQYKSIAVTPPFNQWHFVAFTFDASSGTANAYLDGTLVQKSTGWAGIDPNSYTDIYISRNLPLIIDDARIYNRALSASEIQELYASTIPILEQTATTAGATLTATYYQQFSNTLQITPLAQTTFDGGLTYSPTLTSLGTSISFIAITPASGAGASTGLVWSDYNQPITSPTSLSGAGANIRWENAAGTTSSVTPTSGGNTYNTNYYKQLYNTFSANPSSPATFSPSITFIVSGTSLGTSATICTISVPASPSAGAYSCAGWSDYNTAVSLPLQSTNNPANIAWVAQASSTRTFTPTTGGNTYTANYYEQVYITADLNSNNLQICDPSYSQSITIPLYAYNPTPYVILPPSACGGISGAWYIYQDHVNFTNIYFGSLSNPGHTFGVGVQNANVTVTDTTPASPNSIFYNLNCIKGNTVYAWFYLPKGYVPNSVAITSGSSSYGINPNYFITSLSVFNSAPAPAIYYDQTNGILEAKAICDPTTIQWNIAPLQTSPGGPGGGQGGSPPPSTSSTTSQNQLPQVPQVAQSDFSLLLFVIAVLLIIVYAYSYVEKQRSPITKAKKRLKPWI